MAIRKFEELTLNRASRSPACLPACPFVRASERASDRPPGTKSARVGSRARFDTSFDSSSSCLDETHEATLKSEQFREASRSQPAPEFYDCLNTPLPWHVMHALLERVKMRRGLFWILIELCVGRRHSIDGDMPQCTELGLQLQKLLFYQAESRSGDLP